MPHTGQRVTLAHDGDCVVETELPLSVRTSRKQTEGRKDVPFRESRLHRNVKDVKEHGRNSPWKKERMVRWGSERRSRQRKELAQETWTQVQQQSGAADIF